LEIKVAKWGTPKKYFKKVSNKSVTLFIADWKHYTNTKKCTFYVRLRRVSKTHKLLTFNGQMLENTMNIFNLFLSSV
jgi:hypothetical protein